MSKRTIAAVTESTVVWENLEEMTRRRVQAFVQEILEEEVTELLQRRKSERRPEVDAAPGYRNGHGKPRKLTLASGTVTLERPRVRGLDERFESRVLPLFQRRTETVSGLIPELYLHGLAEGDFDLALRGVLGDEAPLSASTVARLKDKWHGEKAAWDLRTLAGLEVVYLWVDGVYVKAGLEKDKACVFVAIAGLADGTKNVVALTAGHRESKTAWAEFLRSLVARGMVPPRVVVGDGNLGIWGAVSEIFPSADEQRCWNHKIVNVIDRLPKRLQQAGKELVKVIPYAETEAEARSAKSRFDAWCKAHGQASAAETLARDWERMTTFYRYPSGHWRHLRTSNIVESPFAALRLRTDAAKRYRKVERATAVIWKMLLIGEKSFRKLNAPELLAAVYAGATCKDGVIVTTSEELPRKRA